MRLLASWEQYLATADDDGRPGPPVRDRDDRRAAGRRGRSGWPIETDYPWTGRVVGPGLEHAGRAVDAVAAGPAGRRSAPA